uniref:C2H2-type domain-containing protein n=1 Tax=Timema douglasi TaxID=61478 RepID=A0A7R8Z4T8_TIMDO|nr:unnamed protein product [Timema douglasi]
MCGLYSWSQSAHGPSDLESLWTSSPYEGNGGRNPGHKYMRGNKDFACSKCGKRYSWKSNLSRHMTVECGKKPNHMLESLTSSNQINSCYLDPLDSPAIRGEYYCPNCGKKYSWKGNLQRHMNKECGKAPELKCPYCPYATTRSDTLTLKSLLANTDTKKAPELKCPYCPYATTRSDTLTPDFAFEPSRRHIEETFKFMFPIAVPQDISLNRTKAHYLTPDVLAPYFRKQSLKDFKGAYYTFCYDETANATSYKELQATVRYWPLTKNMIVTGYLYIFLYGIGNSKLETKPWIQHNFLSQNI